jgi:hypothetical protein
MFERLAKLVKTDRVRSWRLDQAARSIFLMDFVSAFFLSDELRPLSAISGDANETPLAGEWHAMRDRA